MIFTACCFTLKYARENESVWKITAAPPSVLFPSSHLKSGSLRQSRGCYICIALIFYK